MPQTTINLLQTIINSLGICCFLYMLYEAGSQHFRIEEHIPRIIACFVASMYILWAVLFDNLSMTGLTWLLCSSVLALTLMMCIRLGIYFTSRKQRGQKER